VKFIISFILFFVATINSFATIESSPVNQLTRYLGSYTTYAANFHQLNVEDNEVAGQAKGSIYLQRPGHFRWDQSWPQHQITYLNNNQLIVYDADLMQATKRTIKNINESQNPAALLTGRVDDLMHFYNVKKVILQKKPWFLLTPKSKNAGFQRIYFNFGQGHLAALIVINNLGEKSLYTFSQVEVNRGIPNHYFEFDPPRGVDINVEK